LGFLSHTAGENGLTVSEIDAGRFRNVEQEIVVGTFVENCLDDGGRIAFVRTDFDGFVDIDNANWEGSFI